MASLLPEQSINSFSPRRGVWRCATDSPLPIAPTVRRNSYRWSLRAPGRRLSYRAHGAAGWASGGLNDCGGKSAQAPPRPRDRPSAGHRTRPTRWRPDQGYTGEGPAQTALEGSSYRSSSFRRRSRLCLVATRGVVDRIFGWLNGFHRLARHYGRSAETLADLRFVIFSVPMLIQSSPLSKSA
ncbi:hypothetical protein OKW34_004367 [Paraburkholderia youngii]